MAMAARNAEFRDLDPEGRERVTLEATYQLTLNPPAPVEPPARVPNPAGVFIIPSATGGIPPLNAYPMPEPPKPTHLARNPLAAGKVPSAEPLPPLPPSLHIDIPFTVEEAAHQDVGLSKQRTIRDLAMEAITYNVQRLLAANAGVDEVHTIEERNENELTLRIIMRHFNPQLEFLANVLTNDAEKRLVRYSLWRSGPPTKTRMASYGEYVHNSELLAERLGRLSPYALPHEHRYMDNVMRACNKLLHFIEAPSSDWIQNHDIMKGFEVTPRGGWIQSNRMINSTLDYGLEEKRLMEAQAFYRKIEGQVNDEESGRGKGLIMPPRKRQTKL